VLVREKLAALSGSSWHCFKIFTASSCHLWNMAICWAVAISSTYVRLYIPHNSCFL